MDSLDPAVAFTILTWQIGWATCATLMRFPDRPRENAGTVLPEAAEAFPRVSRDRREYVFRVRRGLRFSDGRPITAASFARALGRVLDKRMRSYGAFTFQDVAAVSARGRTLRISLKAPSGDLPTRLAIPFACPVPAGTPIDPAGIDARVGSGPYYVARRVRGREVVLERNRFYRGRRVGRVDRIVVHVRGTNESIVREVERGTLDYAAGTVDTTLPYELLPELIAKYGLGKRQLFRMPATATYYLALNTSRPLFRNNARLRRAINLALDRREIVRATGRPLAYTRTDQLLAPGMPGFEDAAIYPLNGPRLREARRLAAGHLRGRTVVFYIGAIPFWFRQAEVIKYNLERIGLRVDVRAFAPAVRSAKIETRGEPYDLVGIGWAPDYPDPANTLVTIFSRANAVKPTGNLNYARFTEPRYQRRLAAAAAMTGSRRFRAFARLEHDILREQAPVAPLFTATSYLFFSKRVGCVGADPIIGVNYATVCLR